MVKCKNVISFSLLLEYNTISDHNKNETHYLKYNSFIDRTTSPKQNIL